MLFLHDYISQFRNEGPPCDQLADLLQQTKNTYDTFQSGVAHAAFGTFVDRYNWLGRPQTKAQFAIEGNLARNLPGALMQDYLLHLVIQLCSPYPQLDVFTEVQVSFGNYPLWSAGTVSVRSPSEHSDLAVGHLVEQGLPVIAAHWPKQPYYRLARHQNVLPLVTVNSKIRVSQSEFFDWLGREQLMTKGNPHCLSVQVALRKEMDLNVVEAAQARDKFFLLGEGTETGVVPSSLELDRFVTTLSTHLAHRMR